MMIRVNRIMMALIFTSIIAFHASAQSLKVYNLPNGAIPINNSFTVKARVISGEWQNLPNYDVKIFNKDAVYPNDVVPNHASMCYMSFSGTIEMTVTFNGGNINSFLIRPDSFNIHAVKNGNTLTFRVTQDAAFPRKFVVIINNDLDHCLHILGNPPEGNPPSLNSPTVYAVKPGTEVGPLPAGKTTYYFLPGLHVIKSQLMLKSNQNVYIDGSAIVMGGIKAESGAYGITVRGRGIFDGQYLEHNMLKTRIPFIDFGGCSYITLEGITIIDPPSWGIIMTSPNSKMVNVSEIGYNWNSDGLWLNGANNTLVSGLFIRSADDLICCHNGHDIVVKNSVLWGDKAHIIFMGIRHDTAINNTFQNIDVIGHREVSPNFQGVLAIQSANGSVIKNITFQDIRIAPFRDPNYGKVISIHLNILNEWSKTAGNDVGNITLKNIYYAGNTGGTSEIVGKDALHAVKGVHIINFVRGSSKARSLESSKIKLGAFAKDVTIR